MGNTILKSIKRRRLQRWLRREAVALAREAQAFGCPEMLREAHSLLRATGGTSMAAAV